MISRAGRRRDQALPPRLGEGDPLLSLLPRRPHPEDCCDNSGVRRRLMRALGDAARREGDCYLTGGATAVLLGWRPTTLDVDIRVEPEQDEVLRALVRIKEELAVNVELASPADF